MINEVQSLEQLRQQVAELQQELVRCKSDAQQMESALRQSQRKLATLISNLPGTAYRCQNDRQWTVEFVSDGCLQLLGYQPVDLIAGRTIRPRDIIHPEDLPAVQREIQEAIDQKRRFQLVYRIRTAAGEEKWVWDQAIAVYSEGGCLEALEGFIMDVTGRKQAELALRQARDELEQKVQQRTAQLAEANQQLRQGERRFRKYFHQGLIGMAATSWDKKWLEVNDRLCEILGYSKDEIFDKTWADVTHPDDLELDVAHFNRLLSGEIDHYSIDKRFLRKDGGIVYATIMIQAFHREDGSVDSFAGLMEDITARKQAEDALRQSRDELQAIYDGMVDGLLIADIETKQFVRANGSICRMLGYAEDELLGMSVVNIHPASELPAVFARFQAQAEGRVQVGENTAVLRKDGSIFHADIVSTRVTYAGRPCVIGFFRDVTERKRAQEALRKEQQVLKHLLRASDHERQLIAYDIHDSLAQLLAGAIMQLQVFEHLADKNSPEAAKVGQAAADMLRQAHFEARRLISGVRPPILDESGIVAAIAHLVHDRSFEQGPKIEFRSNVRFQRLAPVLENAVYRIVQEGLTNARQHSRSQKVRVGLVQRGQHVQIEIRDWGIGFAPEKLKEHGYGIEGIHQRARLLGGRATIQSAPDKGTRVRVELPLVLKE